MGNLWLIDWDDHCQDADSNARNETTNVKHCDHNAGSLDGAADDENAACHQDGPATAEAVRVRGEEGAAEASCREQSDYCTGSGIGVGLEEALLEGVWGYDFCDDTTVSR
jgi:hypothetical protein